MSARQPENRIQPVAPNRAKEGAKPEKSLGPRRAEDEQALPVMQPLSSGAPLPQNARAFFESRFERDFSNVRVHTDPRSVASAQALGAAAYTIGSHIVFGTDGFQPDDPSGQRLIAHELTHVVQQRSGGDQAAETSPAVEPARVMPTHSASEAEADRVAASLGAGAPLPSIRSVTGVGIALQPQTAAHTGGEYGEREAPFGLGKSGYEFYITAAGDEGHKLTAHGFDFVAYDPVNDVLLLGDNKSLGTPGTVGDASALTRNLVSSLDDAIARISAQPASPHKDVVLGKLRASLAAASSGARLPAGVRLAVTNAGGYATGLSSQLRTDLKNRMSDDVEPFIDLTGPEIVETRKEDIKTAKSRGERTGRPRSHAGTQSMRDSVATAQQAAVAKMEADAAKSAGNTPRPNPSGPAAQATPAKPQAPAAAPSPSPQPTGPATQAETPTPSTPKKQGTPGEPEKVPESGKGEARPANVGETHAARLSALAAAQELVRQELESVSKDQARGEAVDNVYKELVSIMDQLWQRPGDGAALRLHFARVEGVNTSFPTMTKFEGMLYEIGPHENIRVSGLVPSKVDPEIPKDRVHRFVERVWIAPVRPAGEKVAAKAPEPSAGPKTLVHVDSLADFQRYFTPQKEPMVGTSLAAYELLMSGTDAFIGREVVSGDKAFLFSHAFLDPFVELLKQDLTNRLTRAADRLQAAITVDEQRMGRLLDEWTFFTRDVDLRSHQHMYDDPKAHLSSARGSITALGFRQARDSLQRCRLAVWQNWKILYHYENNRPYPGPEEDVSE